MPVQSALTVYVAESGSLQVTSPLKLEESTPFILPLPSKTAYLADGERDLLIIALDFDPIKGEQIRPVSVASEHFFAPATPRWLAYTPAAGTRNVRPRPMVDNLDDTSCRSLLFPGRSERPAPFAYGTTLHLGVCSTTLK